MVHHQPHLDRFGNDLDADPNSGGVRVRTYQAQPLDPSGDDDDSEEPGEVDTADGDGTTDGDGGNGTNGGTDSGGGSESGGGDDGRKE